METVGPTVRAVGSEWEERDQVQMRPRLPAAGSPAVAPTAAVPQT